VAGNSGGRYPNYKTVTRIRIIGCLVATLHEETPLYVYSDRAAENDATGRRNIKTQFCFLDLVKVSNRTELLEHNYRYLITVH
jgi:hypothetical protein